MEEIEIKEEKIVEEVLVEDIVEPAKEEQEELDISSVQSSIQNLDESISEKFEKMIPSLIEKIKEEIMNESCLSSEKSFVKVKEEKSQIVHRHVICDECMAKPITGIRYKCAVCADFDLCEKCEAKSTHEHPFLKIRHPGQTPAKIVVVLDSED